MQSSLICLDMKRLIYNKRLKFFIIFIAISGTIFGTRSKSVLSLNYIRSSDLLPLNYTQEKLSLDAERSSIEWASWQKLRMSKLRLLSAPEALNSLINPLNQILEKLASDFLVKIRSEPVTQRICDKKYIEISQKFHGSDRLLLQLFDPVDLNQNSHPCLYRLQHLYRYINNKQQFQLQIMKSLDWRIKYPNKQDLILYLWGRRDKWNSYIPDQWHDLTPTEVKVSRYSSIVHSMNVQKNNLNPKIASTLKADKIATINADLLSLMHPSRWRFDTRNSKYLDKSVSFRDIMQALIYNNFKIAFKDKIFDIDLEKRYEEYLALSQLSYLSEEQTKLAEEQIGNDIDNVTRRLKANFKLEQLILTNLRFNWENKSLNAFQSVLQSDLMDVTAEAIKELHGLNGLKPGLTQHILNILYKEQLIPR